MNKTCEKILLSLEKENKIKVWRDFIFPKEIKLTINLNNLLEEKVDNKYFLSDRMINYLIGNTKGAGNYPRKDRWFSSLKSSNEKGIATTITTHAGNRPSDNYILNNINVIGNYSPSKYNSTRVVDKNGIAPTVMENHGNITAIVDDLAGKVRKLTPKECWRLMGFNDEVFDKAQKTCSNTQLYKQAGNSIVVNVLTHLLKCIYPSSYIIDQIKLDILKMLDLEG